MNNCKIAIAGIGVVGTNVLEYIINEQEYLTINCNNIKPVVTEISSKTERKYKDIKWHNNPLDLLKNESTDVIIELIGGADGIAYDLVLQALKLGKKVITANKALIAKHGTELFEIAKKNNTCLYFEAAVAGAVPIIKTLHDNLSGNKISEIYGILNGTCNFILSEMSKKDVTFAEVLKIAQEKGFAEADPTLDIEGIDAAHKIAILSAIAFNTEINFSSVEIKGIKNISKKSFKLAHALGCTIKLLAKSSLYNKQISHYVRPFIVNNDHPISSINAALNSVYIKSDLALDTILTGHGAGGLPTASSVIANICDITRNNQQFFPNINNYKYINNNITSQKLIIDFKDKAALEQCKQVFIANKILFEEKVIENINYMIVSTKENLNYIEKLIAKIDYIGLFEFYE